MSRDGGREPWEVPGVPCVLEPCALRGELAEHPPRWAAVKPGDVAIWQRGPRDGLYGKRVVLLTTTVDCAIAELCGASGVICSQPHYLRLDPKPYYAVDVDGHRGKFNRGPWWQGDRFVVVDAVILQVHVDRIGARARR